MRTFVAKDSIVRQIWGNADTVLFIFAGAASEFSLNKAVDWLYYTGKLPADPLDRLFSTVAYSRSIIFADEDVALQAINRITAIHQGVEKSRGSQIPDWAYRDVLFMLIDYSIRSFELLERKLTPREKQEVFDVFYRMGMQMSLKQLPASHTDWLIARQEHLEQNLIKSEFSIDLYKQYKKHLGWLRYHIMLGVQSILVPTVVKQHLGLNNALWIKPVLFVYKKLKYVNLAALAKNLLLPVKYKQQIAQLNVR
ncbi:oxygenase MpaB family protein [Mucilaginibacter defluvii]|uniref:ER-bound oxygenase mpaB/mpaB'/Rubber oxygenase catalytic domain-containing protein n=1 Tax=Mucilaginibacter defluvii TaxID=1196019 RepID=A0ABP9FSM3_9SPHI